MAVIGAGIAGVSAAVYLKRAGLEFSLFEAKVVGGQLLFVDQVDNYVGLPVGLKGPQMALSLAKTLSELGIAPLSQEIETVRRSDSVVLLRHGDHEDIFDGLIIATGAAFRSLGVKGEEAFRGRGVSYCAICDGFFYKGKTVAVVGGGNTAVEDALYLSGIAQKVYLIHRRDSLRAMAYLQKELFAKKNIEVIFDSVVEEVVGEGMVTELKLTNVKSAALRGLQTNGVFVAIGVSPATDTFKDIVERDEGGFIVTDEAMQTSCAFIWACGDCRRRPLRQLITAAAEGATAAISAYRYLQGGYISS